MEVAQGRKAFAEREGFGPGRFSWYVQGGFELDSWIANLYPERI